MWPPPCDPSTCLFGTCVANQCVCSPGFAHDQAAVHNGAANCGRPESTYVATMVVSILIAISCNAYLFVALKERKRTRVYELTAGVMLFNTLVAIESIVEYAEDGFYEGTAFLTGASVCVFAVWSLAMLSLFVTISFGVHPEMARSTNRILRANAVAICALWIACSVAMMVTARRDDVAFNIALCAAYGVSMIAMAAYAVSFYTKATRLLSMLGDSAKLNVNVSGKQREVAATRRRILRFRAFVCSLFAALGMVAPLLPVLYGSLGQFPFGWLFQTLIQTAGPLALSFSQAVLLKRELQTSSKPSTNSKDATGTESRRFGEASKSSRLDGSAIGSFAGSVAIAGGGAQLAQGAQPSPTASPRATAGHVLAVDSFIAREPTATYTRRACVLASGERGPWSWSWGLGAWSTT